MDGVQAFIFKPGCRPFTSWPMQPGQLILRKNSTRQTLRLNAPNSISAGHPLQTPLGSLQRSSDPLAVFRGPTSKGREGRGGDGRKREREGMVKRRRVWEKKGRAGESRGMRERSEREGIGKGKGRVGEGKGAKGYPLQLGTLDPAVDEGGKEREEEEERERTRHRDTTYSRKQSAGDDNDDDDDDALTVVVRYSNERVRKFLRFRSVTVKARILLWS